MVKAKKPLTKKDKLKLSAKDIGARALKTFVQAFIGGSAVLAAATSEDELRVALISLVGSAASAAISVVWNSVLVVRDK